MSVVSVLTRALATSLFAPIATSPKIWTSTSDPTAANDSSTGAKIGDWWLNTATGNEFRAISVGAAAAVWRHVPRLLAYGNAQLTNTGNTNENVKVLVPIAAGVIGIDGGIEVIALWSATNNANNKTRRVRFGASGSGTSGTVFRGLQAASWQQGRDFTQWKNRGVANAQIASDSGSDNGGWAQNTSAVKTGTIDTSAATEVNITAQVASAGDSLNLEYYEVWLKRP